MTEPALRAGSVVSNEIRILPPVFRRHGKLLATVCTAGCKDATAVGSAHALAEAVLVDALAV